MYIRKNMAIVNLLNNSKSVFLSYRKFDNQDHNINSTTRIFSFIYLFTYTIKYIINISNKQIYIMYKFG